MLQAISLREMEDVAALEEKLGRSLSKQERSRIGVSSLKKFLEELLRQRYVDRSLCYNLSGQCFDDRSAYKHYKNNIFAEILSCMWPPGIWRVFP